MSCYFSASEDFIPRVNLPVTFAAGESERFVEVGIIDDNVYETQECFMAVLELPAGSNGVQLGQQSQANAIIFDDDGTSKFLFVKRGRESEWPIDPIDVGKVRYPSPQPP